ncbi:MAG: hypothetical protein L7S64_10560 [Longimicrobiales bacterium]|nr:hypothetical protein [Longimicrobiales bacterium]
MDGVDLDTGESTPFADRVYTCGHCGFEGRGFILEKQAPADFWGQPSPSDPMSWEEFLPWAALLALQFPDQLKWQKGPDGRSLEGRRKELLESMSDDALEAAMKITAERQALMAREAARKRSFAGEERNCPECGTRFRSVQDMGSCPSCHHVFRASDLS